MIWWKVNVVLLENKIKNDKSILKDYIHEKKLTYYWYSKIIIDINSCTGFLNVRYYSKIIFHPYVYIQANV